MRQIVIFGQQDLSRSAPFPRIDLVLCRNVLIYMDTFLQKKALSGFHYSLKEKGFLVLGTSEAVSAANELFVPFDKEHKVFLRKQAHAVLLLDEDSASLLE